MNPMRIFETRAPACESPVCRLLPLLGAALLLIAMPVKAQPSTGTLWPARRWVVDVAAGPEVGFLTGSLGGADGREGSAFGVMGALRGRLAAHVYLGATGWHVERRPQANRFLSGSNRHDRITALGVEAMLGIPLYRHVRLSATGGVGAALSVRSTGTAAVAGNVTNSRSGSGSMPMFGVTLEIGRLQLSQKALLLLGAGRVIVDYREYYPLTVGWRF
jgi:hypothetical protein